MLALTLLALGCSPADRPLHSLPDERAGTDEAEGLPVIATRWMQLSVCSEESTLPVGEARLQLWLEDATAPQLLDEATTTDAGEAELRVAEAHWDTDLAVTITHDGYEPVALDPEDLLGWQADPDRWIEVLLAQP